MKLTKKLFILNIILIIVILISNISQRKCSFGELVLITMLGFLLYFPLMLYFFPTFRAEKREHPHVDAIFIINLLFGWTFIGWIVAFAWSSSKKE